MLRSLSLLIALLLVSAVIFSATRGSAASLPPDRVRIGASSRPPVTGKKAISWRGTYAELHRYGSIWGVTLSIPGKAAQFIVAVGAPFIQYLTNLLGNNNTLTSEQANWLCFVLTVALVVIYSRDKYANGRIDLWIPLAQANMSSMHRMYLWTSPHCHRYPLF